MVLPETIRSTLDSLPNKPGVYCLKDLQGEILYIGKSKNLNDRVQTYFRPTPGDRKTAHLRALTKSIDYLVLNTDHQAQEVEWDLIKQHRPAYNTVYLDYWNHPYLKLTTDEAYPRIAFTNKTNDDNAEYFGPFKSTRRLRMMMTALQEVYPIRTCDLSIPPGGDSDQFEACYEYQLGRCSAPCIGKESVEDYRSRLEDIREFLNGNYETVLESLDHKMQSASANHNYESASIYRDRLDAVENLVSYEPFIRQTMQADVWGSTGSTTVHLEVREHRVKDFNVHPFSLRRAQTKYYCNHYRPKRVVHRRNYEEIAEGIGNEEQNELEKLIESADWTAEYHDERSDDETLGITDYVEIDKNQLTVRRTANDSKQETRFTVSTDGSVLRDEVMPRYQKDVEQGRCLPNRVVVSADSSDDLVNENLFADRDFWFPILVE